MDKVPEAELLAEAEALADEILGPAEALRPGEADPGRDTHDADA